MSEYANYSFTIFILFVCGAILYKILSAHKGKEMFIRKITGLDSIDEAVGRATEMGRPIFFTPGLGDLNITTLAALAILSRIAKLSARYNNRLIMTTVDPVVYTVAEEICREAYSSEGRAELFEPERDILYLSGRQFPYAMGSAGIMHREKVAAGFMFGSFAAESLILAEAGSQIGAIQVAGTDSTLQIPFFITTCDYTLIGEELYAASAYISKQPTMLGSLVGQDIGKMTMLILFTLGVIAQTLVVLHIIDFNFVIDIFSR